MNFLRLSPETGAALLIILIALLLFTILGFYMTLNATTGLYISDNFESQVQATYAALAGLNHARALLRGLSFDDLLKGPNGTFDHSSSYISGAKDFQFRNPISLMTAHSLKIHDPSDDISLLPDDGLINTGYYGGKDGIALIPMSGIGMTAPDPYKPGILLTSRYFVKITDNNGEASEIGGDLNDSPFADGDGIVIARSMGVSKTMPYTIGSVLRRNSAAIFEARFKRLSTWDLGPALVVIGSEVNAALNGDCSISGGESPGIGTIDPIPGDTAVPDQIITAAAKGCSAIPAGESQGLTIEEISDDIGSDTDKSLLLNPQYLWDFVHNQVPKIADIFFGESQDWPDASAPYLGYFDYTKPLSAEEQDPKIAVVNGNLHVSGGFSGGGILVITGDFSFSGPITFNGLVLVVGSGSLVAKSSAEGISGGVVIANLSNYMGDVVFGTPSISIGGHSRISSQRDAVKMAIGLLPAAQISFREITNSDP